MNRERKPRQPKIALALLSAAGLTALSYCIETFHVKKNSIKAVSSHRHSKGSGRSRNR
jgi:hypothetical protein